MPGPGKGCLGTLAAQGQGQGPPARGLIHRRVEVQGAEPPQVYPDRQPGLPSLRSGEHEPQVPRGPRLQMGQGGLHQVIVRQRRAQGGQMEGRRAPAG